MSGGGEEDEGPPLVCDRCGRILYPGRGGHYLIKIEAVADPAGPVLDAADLAHDATAELDALIKHLQTLSPQAALDQVYRRVHLALCSACYRDWIEHPVG